MPQVAEIPLTAFDSDTGREAGLRSAAIRQQQAQELENLRTLISTKPLADIIPPNPVNEEVQRQVNLANSLIAHAHSELDNMDADDYMFCKECKRHGADPKDRAALMREIRGLMEHLCRLHNIAQAPTSKALQPSRQQRRAIPEPVAIPPVVGDGPTPT